MARSEDADAFRPAWWLRDPHAQTLWAALARRRPRVHTSHERFELNDGDFIDLAWAGASNGPLVLVLHGLEGDHQSKYALSLLSSIVAHGWGGVVLQFRGCSGVPNRLDRGYHSGDTKDFADVLAAMATRYPHRCLLAVGYSLGGNVLLKFLGNDGVSSPLDGAAAVSVPYDLAAAANRLNQGFSRIYQQHLIKSLRSRLKQKFSKRVAPISLRNIDAWDNFRDYDNNVTAPLHGFKDVDDYYAQSSCKQYLEQIETPTLLIHARDDPFLHEYAIPTDTELSSNVQLEVYDHGGHVGFVGGKLPFIGRYWLDLRLMKWLKMHYENYSSSAKT